MLQIGRRLYIVIALRGHQRAPECGRALAWVGFAAVPWTAGVFVEGWARTGVWALAVAIEYGGTLLRFPTPFLGRGSIAAWTVAPERFLERFRLFHTATATVLVLAAGPGTARVAAVIRAPASAAAAGGIPNAHHKLWV